MGTYYNTITTTILNDSKIFAANDSSTHNNERIKCDNDYQPTQLNPSLPDSSANWNNSKNHSSQDTFEPAKVAAENDRIAVDATILLEIRTMKKHMDSLHLVLEGVSAQLTELETRILHLESSMDDLKVSVGNNHGITDEKSRPLANILCEVQNVKDKQDILQAQLETQTSDISNLVQQASSVSASVPMQSQQYLPLSFNLPQSIHVVFSAIAPHQHGLPSPIQLPNQFAQIPSPTVPQRDPYLPPLVHSQDIPNQQYQLPLTQQSHPQLGAPPHQQYQQTPHSQYSQPAPHLSQLQSAMGHSLEEPPYAPSQNYPPNLRHPPSQPHSRPQPPQQFYGVPPQGYEPPSSISGASYSSGYGTLSGPAEPNRYGRLPQYGTPPQGYEPPSSRFGASYSSRYDTLSEIAEPNRYGGPPQYGGKQPQLHTASVAYISGSGYPQLPTAHVLPQAIPTESAVSVGSGSPGAGNRVSVDHVVEKVSTMGFLRDHVRAMVRKLTENILILLFLYHLFLFLG